MIRRPFMQWEENSKEILDENRQRHKVNWLCVVRKTMPKVTRALNGIEILSLNADASES